MPALAPYAGYDRPEPAPIASEPSETDLALRAAEAEVERLKAIVRSQEGALKVAAKVLLPYLRANGRESRNLMTS